MRTHNTNSLAATRQLLSIKGIRYDPQQLKDDLLGHPDYPSLFSVHHVLRQYGIQNSPVEVNNESLDELGQPFLAYMQLPNIGYDFATVTNVHNGTITYTNSKGKPETISRQDFLTKWKNVAVMVDGVSNEKSLVPVKSATGTFNIKLIGAIAIVLLLITTILNASTPLIFAPWLLLKFCGLAITVLLLMYEADRQNETVKQFCSAGKTINCDAVLQSKGAKIGPFSWSEMGFAYFAGTLLYLLIAGNTPNSYLPLAVLSLLVLPYTIYSVYYQYKVVKQWCRLCLFVQGIIVAEAVFTLFAVILPGHWELLLETWTVACLLLPLLLLPLVSWLALKPSFKKAAMFEGYKYAYLRLQNDPAVFFAMLQRQMPAPAGYETCSILIGNPNAKHEIIKICNPYCGPCALAHPVLEALVGKYDIKLRIMFLATNNDGDKKGETARHFIALAASQNITIAKNAMHWWYTNTSKDIDYLRKLFPADDTNSELTKELLEQMQTWNEQAEITFTPTIYVNEYRLPEMYRIEDLNILFGNE
ncbi:MAG: vitamin K epoxide reductase family protein [Chitinophagaceae bacterium]